MPFFRTMYILQKPEDRKGDLSRIWSKPFRSFVYMLFGALSLRYGTRYFQALWIPPQTSNDLISESAVYDTPKSPVSSSFAPRMSIQTMLLPFHDMLPSEDAFTRDPALSVILCTHHTNFHGLYEEFSLLISSRAWRSGRMSSHSPQFASWEHTTRTPRATFFHGLSLAYRCYCRYLASWTHRRFCYPGSRTSCYF
ncbi:hypothetical protein K474DRAFT_46329 [Panus rudis PR-1116 ss-1]|nr:hypothetical protein K474DRAFT_46329 [Panus rudis PR-1116 ss-1]